MMPFSAMRLRKAAGGGGATLYSEIIADSPIHYWRNGEASGSVMVDEITTDGTYSGSPSLGNTPLYTGGPTCMTGFSGPDYGTSAVVPGSITNMTLISVVEFNSLSGYQPIGTNRDENAASRKFQWRTSGTDMEFVNIPGGGITVTQPSGLSAGVPAIVGISITSGGTYIMYVNGASIGTGSVGTANYGGSGDQWQIGFCTGMAAYMDGYTCENAVFNKVLSGARMAAYATAAGL